MANKPTRTVLVDDEVQVPKADIIDSTTRAAILSFSDLAELSKILGKNIRTPNELVEQCRKLSQVSVEGVPITFEPGLLQRLKTRCPTRVDFGEFLRANVKKWAHDYVGW